MRRPPRYWARSEPVSCAHPDPLARMTPELCTSHHHYCAPRHAIKHALAAAASRGGSVRAHSAAYSAPARSCAGRSAHTRPPCSSHLRSMAEEAWRGAVLAVLAVRRGGEVARRRRGGGGRLTHRCEAVRACLLWPCWLYLPWLHLRWPCSPRLYLLWRTAARLYARAVRKEPLEKPLKLEQPRARRLSSKWYY
jgi:hypothetical protein